MTMKTDRELLELAAKAAGYKINAQAQAERDALIDPSTASLWIDEESTAWNPLKDDGAVHRLAVKLRIWLSYGGCATETPALIAAHYLKDPRRRSSLQWVHENYIPEEMFTDTYLPNRKHADYQLERGITRGLEQAARRAIVRAAAAIGEAQP